MDTSRTGDVVRERRPYVFRLSHRYEFVTNNRIDYFFKMLNVSDLFGLLVQEFKNKLLYTQLELKEKRDKIPFDLRVRDTCISVIIDQLETHPDDILFYVISPEGGNAEKRMKKFDRWFSFTGKPDYVDKTTKTLKNQEIHFLYRKDRPSVVSLMNQIETYFPLLRQS